MCELVKNVRPQLLFSEKTAQAVMILIFIPIDLKLVTALDHSSQ